MLNACRPLLRVDVRGVYSMSPRQLREAFRSSSDSKLPTPKIWDALMYRASVIRKDLSVNDISHILDSLRNFPQYSSPMFTRYLVDALGDAVKNGKGVSLSDLTMISRNVIELKVFPDNSPDLQLFLSKRICPILVDKLAPSTRVSELAELARISVVAKNHELMKKIQNTIINRGIEKISQPCHLLPFLRASLSLLQAAHPSTPSDLGDDTEPFYDVSSPKDVSFPASLLNRVITLIPKFNGKDIVEFLHIISTLSDSTLSLLGHPTRTPINSALSRAVAREARSLKPGELVGVLEMGTLVGMHSPVLEKEIAYRIRDISPTNCLKILKNVTARSTLAEPVLTRLVKFDAGPVVTPSDLIEIFSSPLPAPPALLRQVLFNLTTVIAKASHTPSELVGLVDVFSSHKIECRKEIEKVLKRGSIVNQIFADTDGSQFLLGCARLGVRLPIGVEEAMRMMPDKGLNVMVAEAVSILPKFENSNAIVSAIVNALGDGVEVPTCVRRIVGGLVGEDKMPTEVVVKEVIERLQLEGVDLSLGSDFFAINLNSFGTWINNSAPRGSPVITATHPLSADEWLIVVPVGEEDKLFGSGTVCPEKHAAIKFFKTSSFKTIVFNHPTGDDPVTDLISLVSQLE